MFAKKGCPMRKVIVALSVVALLLCSGASCADYLGLLICMNNCTECDDPPCLTIEAEVEACRQDCMTTFLGVDET